jgi:N-glycosylase/DNA lyase
MEQFLRIDTDQILQRIRNDFESFYSTIYQQMIEYYQTKTNELQTNLNQILQYQQNQFEQNALIQNKLQREYQIIERDLNYEKDIFINLESTFGK